MKFEPDKMLMASIRCLDIPGEARAAFEVGAGHFRYNSLCESVVKNLRRLVDDLGFELVEKTTPEINPAASESITEIRAPDNPTEVSHETQVAPPILFVPLTAGAALNTAPAFQDIDQHADGYSAGMSGRVA